MDCEARMAATGWLTLTTPDPPHLTGCHTCALVEDGLGQNPLIPCNLGPGVWFTDPWRTGISALHFITGEIIQLFQENTVRSVSELVTPVSQLGHLPAV